MTASSLIGAPHGPCCRRPPRSDEIVSALGAGGTGEVYRARDTRLDRIVAIKVILGRETASPAMRERFEREARAIALLSHANICTLHDIGHHEGTDFLVMEYPRGRDAGRAALASESALVPRPQAGSSTVAG